MTTPQRADAPAWTPEPWQASDNESDTHPSFHDVEYGHSVAMSASDYERAIACVNALAGIPDPAAHIRTLEAENARLTAALADAKAEGERMRAIVQRVEWLGRNAGFMGRCPLCEAIKGGPHKPGCDLAAALNGPSLFVPSDTVLVSIEDAKAASTACETVASTDTGPSKPEWKARAERLWAAALASGGQAGKGN